MFIVILPEWEINPTLMIVNDIYVQQKRSVLIPPLPVY